MTQGALFAQEEVAGKVEALIRNKVGPAVASRLGSMPADTIRGCQSLVDKGRALELRVKALAPQARGDGDLPSEAGRYLQESAVFMKEEQGRWRSFVEGQAIEDASKRELLSGLDERDASLSIQLGDASRALIGFGGFRSEGVHMISAADPLYPAILQGTVVGAPFSHVVADAVGDSSVMFVQETPTQVRVAEVNTDSTQLVNNVVFITQKALAAAARYSGVPIPAGLAKPTGSTGANGVVPPAPAK